MKSAFLMSLVLARKPAVLTTAPGPNSTPSRLMRKMRPFALRWTQYLRRPEPSDHAIERDRSAVGLIEAHALVHADIERVPVDDGVLGRLVDDHRGAALSRDRRRAADHGAALRPGRDARHPKREQRGSGEQQIT